MRSWPELLDDMIIGLGRDPSPDPGQFLQELALADLARRSGWLPDHGGSLPPPLGNPPPAETKPVCSTRAVLALQRFSGGRGVDDLAMEWFSIVIGRGQRVPHRYVPYILGLSDSKPHWAPYLARVAGERGRWLVEQLGRYPKLKAPELWSDQELEIVIPEPSNKSRPWGRAEMLESLDDNWESAIPR